MPILSFFEGYTELSFVAFTNELDLNDYKIFKFPYTYSYNLFANSFTKENFYSDVFGLALSELGIKLKDYQLYTIGVLEEPTSVPFDVTKSSVLLTSLDSAMIYMNSQTVASNDGISSYFPLTHDADDSALDFRANLDLYHNIIYHESRDIVIKDSLVRAILNTSSISLGKSNVVVTGDRLREYDLNPTLANLLILDTIRPMGVYSIKIDKQNLVAHGISLEFNNLEYENLGTLVNIEGPVECLYESEVGTSQLIDLPKDSIFVIPLEAGSVSRMLVKSADVTIDSKVTGGTLGVIVDTRNKEENLEFKEVNVNYLSQSASAF